MTVREANKLKRNPTDRSPVSGTRGIAVALSSGVLLRIAGAAVNLLAVPIGLQVLGQQDYAASVAILSLAGWLTVGSLGLGNVSAISAAEFKHDSEKDNEVFWQIVIAAGATVTLGSLLAIAPFMLFLRNLVEHVSPAGRQELTYTSYYCFFAFAVCAIGSPFEGRYVGLLRTGYCNFVRLVWQAVAVAMLIATVLYLRSVFALCFALTIAPAGSALWFIAQGVRDFPRPRNGRLRMSTLLRLVGQGIGFLTSSLTVLFYGGGSLPVFALAFGPGQLATAAVVSRIIQVYFSGTAVLLHPLSAALRHALKDNDVSWARTTLIRSLVGLISVGSTSAIMLICFGDIAIAKWTGTALPNIHEWMLPLAVMIFAISWSYLWVYVWFALHGALLVAILATVEVITISGIYMIAGAALNPAWSLYVSSAIMLVVSGGVLPLAALRSGRMTL